MSAFRKSTHTTPQQPTPQPSLMERGEALKKIDLFPVAVFIMGIVSCYTTATGIYPMLNNWILSYATAIALSVFMVAIALRIPQAYREGNQVKLIMGYIFVALFSVLLNFNAIYGMFSSEKLLYEELKENKSLLTAIQVRAGEALDDFYGANETRGKLQQAKSLLEEETSNRVDPGYGKNARRINQESIIPLEAELQLIQAKYDPTVQEIEKLVVGAQVTIDEALASHNISQYREAVDQSVDAYTQVGEMTQNQLGEENFYFEGLVFKHRDVGNLNHSLWTLGEVSKLDGKQASAVIVSLVLALLIDFIVLFVLVLVNKPEKEEKEEEAIVEETNPTGFRKSSSTTTNGHSAQGNSIYAYRRERTTEESQTHRPYAIRQESRQPVPPTTPIQTPVIDELPQSEEAVVSQVTSADISPVAQTEVTLVEVEPVEAELEKEEVMESAQDAQAHLMPEWQYLEDEESPVEWIVPAEEPKVLEDAVDDSVEKDPLAFDLFTIDLSDEDTHEPELIQKNEK
ncbi:MAG: hypothetical protein AAF135_20355 [Bacteroidota bacterium]